MKRRILVLILKFTKTRGLLGDQVPQPCDPVVVLFAMFQCHDVDALFVALQILQIC